MPHMRGGKRRGGKGPATDDASGNQAELWMDGEQDEETQAVRGTDWDRRIREYSSIAQPPCPQI